MCFALHYITYPSPHKVNVPEQHGAVTDYHRKAKIITFLLSPHCHSSLLPISSNCSYNFISFGRQINDDLAEILRHRLGVQFNCFPPPVPRVCVSSHHHAQWALLLCTGTVIHQMITSYLTISEAPSLACVRCVHYVMNGSCKNICPVLPKSAHL